MLILLVPNYYFMTFDSTSYHSTAPANMWQDVLGPNGEKLDIGCITLYKRGEDTPDRRKFANTHHNMFTGPQWDDRCPPPREVKAALLLLLHLPLTFFTEIHTTTDDLMRGISATSRAHTIHTAKGAKCTKPTRTFIKAFISQTCMLC